MAALAAAQGASECYQDRFCGGLTAELGDEVFHGYGDGTAAGNRTVGPEPAASRAIGDVTNSQVLVGVNGHARRSIRLDTGPHKPMKFHERQNPG